MPPKNAAAADAADPAGASAPAGDPPVDPPDSPRSPSPDPADDAILRALPCCRCLRQMVGWDPKAANAASTPLPRCVETKTASNKCARCAGMRGKECVPATRATSAAAMRLKVIFEDLREEIDPLAAYREDAEEIKEAQLQGKKALQKKADTSKAPDAKRKAEAEEEEWLVRQRKLVALETAASSAKKQAKAAEKLLEAEKAKIKAIAANTAAIQAQTEAVKAQTTLFQEWSQSWVRVHANELDSESDKEGASRGGDEEEEEE